MSFTGCYSWISQTVVFGVFKGVLMLGPFHTKNFCSKRIQTRLKRIKLLYNKVQFAVKFAYNFH